MTTESYYEERVDVGGGGAFIQRWQCPVPPVGVDYQVLDDSWDEEATPPIRVIRQVRLVSRDD